MKKISVAIIITTILFFGFLGFGVLDSNAEEHEGSVSSGEDLDYKPLAPLPGVDTGQNISLADYLTAIFRLFLGMAAVLAVLMIVVGGFQYMTTDAIGDKKEGKDRIKNALWGLVLALAAVLILETVNPELLKFDLELKELDNQGVDLSEIGNTPDPTLLPPDGRFTYDDGIRAQTGDVSPGLSELLNCMANELPGNVGRISSISDSLITDGTATFEQCASGELSCAHTTNSCHYGGRDCVGKSYAVDFGDEENQVEILEAASRCPIRGGLGIPAKYGLEGDHVHISVGASYGCGCDENL